MNINYKFLSKISFIHLEGFMNTSEKIKIFRDDLENKTKKDYYKFDVARRKTIIKSRYIVLD